jgi:5-methylcytosine-specific restriction endonuclease McrA
MKRNRERKKARKMWHSSNAKVLVLNVGHMPIDVITWQDAITDWCNGRAEIVCSYDDVWLHSANSKMQCPSVIVKIDSKPSSHDIVKTLPFNRRNILERDKYECAYCSRSLSMSTMTVDHVFPTSRGGLNDWANVRASCTDCNNKKGNDLLSELGWTFKRRVGIPMLSKNAPKSVIVKIGGRVPHDSWKQYIYWSVETEEKIRD